MSIVIMRNLDNIPKIFHQYLWTKCSSPKAHINSISSKFTTHPSAKATPVGAFLSSWRFLSVITPKTNYLNDGIKTITSLFLFAQYELGEIA